MARSVRVGAGWLPLAIATLLVGLTFPGLGVPGASGQEKVLATYGPPEEGPWQEIFGAFCKERACRHVGPSTQT
jgi:hypothetical protein